MRTFGPSVPKGVNDCRSKKCLLYSILSRIRVRRITKAHPCKYCNIGALVKRLEEAKREVNETDDEIEIKSYKAEIEILTMRLKRYKTHIEKKERQRKYVQRLSLIHI